MKIAYLVPGNGNRFYCENCQRDSAQLSALNQLGHEVLAVPLYLPLSAEQPSDHVSPLFFGAVGFYLRETVTWLRSMPTWLRQMADSPRVLAIAARQAETTSARGREDLTIAMLRGDDPVFRSEISSVSQWLSHNFKPDVIHLSNLLLIGLAPRLGESLGVPVVITLQDEHTWIDEFPPANAESAWEIIRHQSAKVSHFLPVSAYYRDFMAEKLGLPAEGFTVIQPGLDLSRYPARPEPALRKIGFLSRWSEAMGFGRLLDAFIALHRDPAFSDVGLVVCGGGTREDLPFLRQCHRKLRMAGLAGKVEFRANFRHPGRQSFLADISVLSVPSTNGEAFGSFILEAVASGIPVVQPRCGGFTELVESCGGGILITPGDEGALTAALARLLSDPAERVRIGSQARAAVAETRSLAHYAHNLVKSYQDAIGKFESGGNR